MNDIPDEAADPSDTADNGSAGPRWPPHPLSAADRDFTEEERSALEADIRKHGVREPVVLLDGQILDGRHRAAIAAEAGVECPSRVFEPDIEGDPQSFVLSANVHRRHLSDYERVRRLLPETHGLALDVGGGVASHEPSDVLATCAPSPSLSARRIADQAGVSRRTVQHVRAVESSGDQEVIRRARDGDIKISRAHNIVRSKQKRAADRAAGKPTPHPAKYSEGLIPAFAALVPAPARVLDPFAGTGRIHEMRDHGDYDTVGVEIEPEWADLHDDTICCDARCMPFEDGSFDAVVTSPTYGNKMAGSTESHFDAADRHGYTWALERPLADGNTGGHHWGDAYRTLHVEAWAESHRVLRPGGRLVLNIKDHWRDGRRAPVTGWHLTHLVSVLGMSIDTVDAVPAPANRSAEHGDLRVGGYEMVFCLSRT